MNLKLKHNINHNKRWTEERKTTWLPWFTGLENNDIISQSKNYQITINRTLAEHVFNPFSVEFI